MIAAHVPVLLVVVPLVAAPIAVALRRGGACWALTAAVCWAAFAAAWWLLRESLAGGTIRYELGGWAAPWGIEYVVGPANAFVLLIVAGVAAVASLFARDSVAREIPPDQHHLFYAVYLLCLAGLLGVTITGDAFNLFVFLEISSLSSYVLVAMGRGRRALMAAFQYLIMGTIGATFIVIGVGLLYMATGTLNMADLAARIPPMEGSRTVLAAFAFIIVGASLKLALFPLHLWLPNAYTYAPSVVSAFLAATGTKVGVYVLLRFVLTIFGAGFAFGRFPTADILLVFALLAMFVGSLVAVFQTDIKRLLAYSSIGQIGYMVLGLGLANASGLTGGFVHLFNHGITKGGLFLAMGCIVYRLGSAKLSDIRGLGRAMPLTMAAFLVGGMGLVGVPLTAGFVSKWYLVLGSLERGLWPVAALVLLSSLIAAVYVWRVIEAAYFQPRPEGAPEAREAPLSLLLPTWLLIGASVWFGIDTSFTVGTARRAAEALLAGGL